MSQMMGDKPLIIALNYSLVLTPQSQRGTVSYGVHHGNYTYIYIYILYLKLFFNINLKL